MKNEPLTNLGIERAVLAALCQFGEEVYVELKELIETDSFSHELNQIIFGCIEDIILK